MQFNHEIHDKLFFQFLKRGNNALHVAVKEGHLEVIRVLLMESQIDAEAFNNKGKIYFVRNELCYIFLDSSIRNIDW